LSNFNVAPTHVISILREVNDALIVDSGQWGLLSICVTSSVRRFCSNRPRSPLERSGGCSNSVGGASFRVVAHRFRRPRDRPEALTRHFYSAKRRASLPTIRLHQCFINASSMLHTWASWVLSERESIHGVAGFLGHSDPGFTLRTYAPFMPNQARETAIRLSSKLAAMLESEIGANLGANIS
jgi:integrase